ncbi:esterase/lipase family protein [Shewanella sp. YLB-07]|uniref:esterase/lipase family protein n=1 Tax=Shewanella sp. YLB-07 TaxID=2601268 RepID=UPI00128B845E|nr:hypothetical protein [Shewanella sp. YLB-07]MPY25364.1 hypothetical protein [Shewanella sp. YLB-07]
MKLALLLSIFLLSAASTHSFADECVVLLHGLGRSAASMEKLEDRLKDHGYVVANIDYPSRKMSIESLAKIAVVEGLETCTKATARQINFVTHSLGGILVRQYYTIPYKYQVSSETLSFFNSRHIDEEMVIPF